MQVISVFALCNCINSTVHKTSYVVTQLFFFFLNFFFLFRIDIFIHNNDIHFYNHPVIKDYIDHAI